MLHRPTLIPGIVFLFIAQVYCLGIEGIPVVLLEEFSH